MKKLTLTADQKKLLRVQTIDLQQPGPILHDFGLVLDYVGVEGVPSGGKNHLLPITAITDLNPRLSRPLVLDLKRPLLRSHPYLLGLNLVFRASGLARIMGRGSKARLAVDPEVLESWQGLNPTEQYFNLLEAWLLHGHPEMVGAWGGAHTAMLTTCFMAWQDVSRKERKFDTSKPSEVYLFSVGREFYHLALMDLFGLLTLEHPKKPVQPWCPAGLRRTAFGDVLLGGLAGDEGPLGALRILQMFDDEPYSDRPRFGRWQKLFQPVFPAWKNNLVVPEAPARAGTFVFKVFLSKDIWRRIAMKAEDTLHDLVGWVLDSVRFDFDHLYEFKYKDRFGTEVCVGHPASHEELSGDEVTIGELPLEVGESMELIYDFGDNWRFEVQLEKVEPPGVKIKAPRILEKEGKAPKQYPYWD